MTPQRPLNFHLQFLLLVFAGWINRHQQAVIEYLQAENQSLREQLGNKRIRWTDAQRRRLAKKAKAIGRSAFAALGTVVTTDTLFRWYRNLVAAKYDGSKKRGPGRSRRKPDIAKLAIRMARENPSWRYTRIRGALYNLGHDIARNTIKAILKERGIEPAPERGRHTSWHTFIQSHLGAIAGADFFTVEILRGFGLVRYWVMFVIDIGTRRVHIAGITDQPSEVWMKQTARELTDCVDGSCCGWDSMSPETPFETERAGHCCPKCEFAVYRRCNNHNRRRSKSPVVLSGTDSAESWPLSCHSAIFFQRFSPRVRCSLLLCWSPAQAQTTVRAGVR